MLSAPLAECEPTASWLPLGLYAIPTIAPSCLTVKTGLPPVSRCTVTFPFLSPTAMAFPSGRNAAHRRRGLQVSAGRFRVPSLSVSPTKSVVARNLPSWENVKWWRWIRGVEPISFSVTGSRKWMRLSPKLTASCLPPCVNRMRGHPLRGFLQDIHLIASLTDHTVPRRRRRR